MNTNKHEEDDWNSPIYMVDQRQIVPVPEVLTEQEVIQLLRLDVDGSKDAGNTLRYYREKGLLRGVRLGKRLRYWKQEILQFLERQTDATNHQMEE